MALESRITQEEIKKEPEKPIDREKVDGGIFFSEPGLSWLKPRERKLACVC